MKKITILDKTFRTYIPNEKIMEAVDRVAQKINSDFAGCKEPPVMLCTLSGAVMFYAALMSRIDFDVEFASVKVSSYAGGTDTTGKVTVQVPPTTSLKGRQVIICEDIVDTGITFDTLLPLMKEEWGASDVKICTLFFKEGKFNQRPHNYTPDYVGMSIENAFIVGFGLDYNELGRNYKDVYVLDV